MQYSTFKSFFVVVQMNPKRIKTFSKDSKEKKNTFRTFALKKKNLNLGKFNRNFKRIHNNNKNYQISYANYANGGWKLIVPLEIISLTMPLLCTWVNNRHFGAHKIRLFLAIFLAFNAQCAIFISATPFFFPLWPRWIDTLTMYAKKNVSLCAHLRCWCLPLCATFTRALCRRRWKGYSFDWFFIFCD